MPENGGTVGSCQSAVGSQQFFVDRGPSTINHSPKAIIPNSPPSCPEYRGIS